MNDKTLTKTYDKIYVDKVFYSTDPKVYDKIKIDQESLMYVTNYKDASSIADILSVHIRKFKQPKESLVVDATGGIGGDTIAFSKRFMNVISIEKDDTRYDFLKNNISAFELKNVVDIHGNSLDIIPKIGNIDIIYIDPPWGGKNYKDKETLRLNFGDKSLEDVIKYFVTSDEMKDKPKVIGLKLPKNYDIANLYDQLKENELKIYYYQLKKICLIVIENTKLLS